MVDKLERTSWTDKGIAEPEKEEMATIENCCEAGSDSFSSQKGSRVYT